MGKILVPICLVPICISLFLFEVGLVCGAGNAQQVRIWPMPKYFRNGHKTLFLGNDFELSTSGSKYSDRLGILKDGFLRFMGIVTQDHVIDANFSRYPQSGFLKGVHVVIHSSSDKLSYVSRTALKNHPVTYGVDESYNLSVPAAGNPTYAHIEANSVYGALHGLQTFSQLCNYNFKTRLIEVGWVPWTIVDGPRFPYRGLLIDTSRHYLPVPVIKNVIDSMTYAKLNVLHWHIVDSQSFPLEIPSYPNLWKGAYSGSERYTMADAAEIVSYARRQGVNVLAEIDVPGHAGSWGVGYPSLWPSPECKEPLDVSSDFTFQVIDGILSDFKRIFNYRFVHLGGDEVDTTCWETTPRVSKWMEAHKMNGSEAYQYFVLKAQKIALSHGYDIINWEETFNKFGSKLDRRTVVHNWLGSGVAEQVTAAGLRCIVSNQDKWYLDHLDITWQDFYSNEPLANITNPNQQRLVLGGEVCMWGEHIDASDIQQTIWPRAAAAAERLWTPYEKLARNPGQVAKRLSHFRCLLNQRGIAAAPLQGPGRIAPEEPGSCSAQ
uniref:Beta-hexosaminidase n=2 Tax=Opuntia streptacantha TaxID=393608 RepID=A0A7C9EL37_OPUST